MKTRLALSPARPPAATVPALTSLPSPSATALAPAPFPVFAPAVQSPSAEQAPRPALDVLSAAEPAPEAAPEALFAAGRRIFDAQDAASPAAVAGTLSTPAGLGRAQATSLRAAVAVPVAAPLAAAGPSGIEMAVGIGLAFLVLWALRALVAPRVRKPSPRPPMPPASGEFADLKVQTYALTEALAAAGDSLRDPGKLSRALSAAWDKIAADGGVAQWQPREGAWRMTPISKDVLQAVELPDILSRIGTRTDRRGASILPEIVIGLNAEIERARDAGDLLERLRWWNRHVRQFFPLN